MSASLTSLRARLEAPDALMNIVATDYDPPRSRYRAALLGLHGGAIVLTVAAFEQYLTEMFQEHLYVIEEDPTGISLSQLPLQIQYQSVVQTLELAIHPPRYLGRSISDIISNTISATGAAAADRIVPASFAMSRQNADSGVVSEYFKNIGASSPWENPQLKADFDEIWGTTFPGTLHQELNRIVDRRHTVAHGGDPLSFSRADINEGVRFMRALGGALDAAVEAHVTTLVAEASP